MVSAPPRPRAYLLAAGSVFALALVAYVPTLLPDVGLWDTAEFQAIGPVLGTAHPTGYPTYTLLAWLASVVLQPFGNEAYRADLLSALLMAGAGALLAMRTVQATRRGLLGLLAGTTFVLTPVAWSWALRADPHALHVFFAALLLVLLGGWASARGRHAATSGRWLLAAAIVYGLSLGNHALTLLLAPGIAAYVLLVAPRILWQQWRLVLACAGALALTAALVYLYLPLRSAMDPPLDYADPETWDAFWYVVLGQQFQGTFSLPAAGDVIAGMWAELWRGLGPLAVVAIVGVLAGLLRHPRLVVLTLLWFVTTWLFAVGYPNAAIERYFLVPLLVACLYVALAAEALWDLLASRWRPPGREGWGQAVAVTAVGIMLLAAAIPAIPRAAQLDASGETWGRTFLEGAFATLPQDAVIISWWSFSTPLWYGRWVEGRREDLLIIDDRDVLDDGYGDLVGAIERYLDERPVYVIRLEGDLASLRQRYRLLPVPGIRADVWAVAGRLTE